MFYEIQPSKKTAIISSEGSCLTYEELADAIKYIGDQLTERRIAFCLCENSPASLVGYLACLNIKTVPLLLDKKINTGLLDNLINCYHPNYLYIPEDMAAQFQGYEVRTKFMNYVLLSQDRRENVEVHAELALLLTTSGSTGSPKLVRQSYKNIQSNAEAIAKYLKLTDEERPITTLPMNYTYGLSIINSHLQAGATILMTDYPMNMKAFWDFFKTEEATSFGGVPFTYEMLKKIHFLKMDLPTLRYMTQAGGKLSPELHKEFAEWCLEKGKSFIVMYGQTEATARMGYLPREKSLEKYGSMGQAIPGGRFILVDASGNEISSPETVGELIYEGDNVTLGYAECLDDLAKGDERGGRLETGDMAKFDSEGYYYIVGRKKRFLKIFGNRVNLDEIDLLIKRTFKDIECASTGVDDHMKTYITRMDLADEVRRWLAATTHLSESAFEVIYIDELPKNEAGKVLYKELNSVNEKERYEPWKR